MVNKMKFAFGQSSSIEAAKEDGIIDAFVISLLDGGVI